MGFESLSHVESTKSASAMSGHIWVEAAFGSNSSSWTPCHVRQRACLARACVFQQFLKEKKVSPKHGSPLSERVSWVPRTPTKLFIKPFMLFGGFWVDRSCSKEMVPPQNSERALNRAGRSCARAPRHPCILLRACFAAACFVCRSLSILLRIALARCILDCAGALSTP